MKDIGNIKSTMGIRFKVFWDANSKRVEFSQHPFKEIHSAQVANSVNEALKNAKVEANKIIPNE